MEHIADVQLHKTLLVISVSTQYNLNVCMPLNGGVRSLTREL